MRTNLPIGLLFGVALALGACGGGGSDEDRLRTDLEAAQQELEQQRQAAEEAEKAAEEAEEARKKAEEAAAEAEEARREAEEEAADAAQAEQDAADAEAARLAAEEAQRQAEQQQEELQQQLTEAERAELSARASQYWTAIMDGGGATGERDGVTVAYERGSTLTINPVGNFETGSGAPAISGFTARTYTREVGVTAEQTLYHYTNIQAPGTRAFWKIHGLEVAAEAAATLNDNTANNPTPTGTPRVVRAGDAPLDYETATTYNIVVSGTYDGVSGTYTCAGSTCSIADRDDDTDTDITAADFNASTFATLSGQREFVTGSWSFKPGSISSGVRQNQDTEYLYFGIWVEEPDSISGDYDYEWFRSGSAPFTAVDTLSGTAKFSGGAVGKYVTRNQVGENDKFGTFTAAANLTATFGASPTLEGRLTDFRDGSQTLTGWNVYLGDTDDTPAEFASGTSSVAGGAKASIGGVSATGDWSAVLHGTPNPGQAELFGADPDKYPLARYPVADLAGVVGNFHATSPNAALAGAFAATPQ